jgi:hypothetical protein
LASEQGEIQDQVVLGRTQTKHSTSLHHQSSLLMHHDMIKPFKGAHGENAATLERFLSSLGL